MADLHTLPMAALPEGWAEGTVIEGEWVRIVGSTVLRARYDVVDDCFYGSVDYVGDQYTDHRPLSQTFRTPQGAMAAVERAWCNCRVRR
jgi:hypothetical protein